MRSIQIIRQILKSSSIIGSSVLARLEPQCQTVAQSVNKLGIVLQTRHLSNQALPDQPTIGLGNIKSFSAGKKTLKLVFGDDTSAEYPYVWMRENCQCNQCFNANAIARLYLMDDLDLDVHPKEVKRTQNGISVEWNDGHVSPFEESWMKKRTFSSSARAVHRSNYMLSRLLWDSKIKLPEIDYTSAMTEDSVLLEWLIALEHYGIILMKKAPAKVGSVNEFIEKIGFIKRTHYGIDYEIINRADPNNLAYTGAKLTLHTDLPYYEYAPGTTWLHCIKQHTGEGGANTLSDGFLAATLLKERHPNYFQTLTTVPIYFQDQGLEIYDFDKINKTTTIVLDGRGEVTRINVSSQSRDSIMDMDVQSVMEFYKALKAFTSILYEISTEKKTEPGDILVIDNMRVLHGRSAFTAGSTSVRHVHNAYIDWDELRSKRRILQNKANNKLS